LLGPCCSSRPAFLCALSSKLLCAPSRVAASACRAVALLFALRALLAHGVAQLLCSPVKFFASRARSVLLFLRVRREVSTRRGSIRSSRARQIVRSRPARLSDTWPSCSCVCACPGSSSRSIHGEQYTVFIPVTSIRRPVVSCSRLLDHR
jgi:hypothetical protein